MVLRGFREMSMGKKTFSEEKDSVNESWVREEGKERRQN